MLRNITYVLGFFKIFDDEILVVPWTTRFAHQFYVPPSPFLITFICRLMTFGWTLLELQLIPRKRRFLSQQQFHHTIEVYKKNIPSMIFGCLLNSSNYDTMKINWLVEVLQCKGQGLPGSHKSQENCPLNATGALDMGQCMAEHQIMQGPFNCEEKWRTLSAFKASHIHQRPDTCCRYWWWYIRVWQWCNVSHWL